MSLASRDIVATASGFVALFAGLLRLAVGGTGYERDSPALLTTANLILAAAAVGLAAMVVYHQKVGVSGKAPELSRSYFSPRYFSLPHSSLPSSPAGSSPSLSS